MKVHLVDGTYELFRNWFAVPEARSETGKEVGATRGFMRSMVAMLHQPDVTHVGCAFDHTVESFRNDLFDGYKTGEGLEPDLLDQFEWVERASRALGLVTWPMVEFEADDALAAAAAKFRRSKKVDQVVICTPDKDLAQCVVAQRVVLLDRRRESTLDAEGVFDKFGVTPDSIPDYLALVGDTADGIPGIPRWGAKSAAVVLARYRHLEEIPPAAEDWEVEVRGASTLAENLQELREEAWLYRELATLRTDAPVPETLGQLEWTGPDWSLLEPLCSELRETSVPDRLRALLNADRA